MQVYKSSLKEYLAEEILRDIFCKNKAMAKVNELREINCNNMSTEEAMRAYARAFQSEVNKKAALIALESLSEEKKMLLKLRYGEEKQLVSISLALDMSVGQLMNCNRAIVTKIANFLIYQLMSEDVFCKRKVTGMIELLERSIEFFLFCPKKVSKCVRSGWKN